MPLEKVLSNKNEEVVAHFMASCSHRKKIKIRKTLSFGLL